MRLHASLCMSVLALTACGETRSSAVAAPEAGFVVDAAQSRPTPSPDGSTAPSTGTDASTSDATVRPLDAGSGSGGSRDATSPPVADAATDATTRTGGDGATRVDGGSAETSTSPFDGPLADSSASPVSTLEIVVDGGAQGPISCPSSNWEYPGPPNPDTYLRNTSSVPLAYISEPGWITGASYVPGVPTGTPGEKVGILAPGAGVHVTAQDYSDGVCPIAIVGSSKPFSDQDGGYATADERTMPWPQGVANSTGAVTMYLAFLEIDSSCSAVGWP